MRPFRVGDHRVDPKRNLVSGPDGDKHAEPRVIELLCCLARRAGQVVSRDELIDEVWNGAYGADQRLTGAISELRRVLGDERRTGGLIETIPKRGYRLCAAVEREPSTTASAASGRGRHSMIAIGVILATLLGGLVLRTVQTGPDWSPAPADNRPASVAVLPFEALSDDEQDRYFADGLTEEIINALTRISALDVTARASSFYFRQRDVPSTEIAEMLDVGHLLQGSVRRDGKRIRISTHLIDAESGNRVWSAAYDRQLDSVFDIQEEVARKVAAALRVGLLAGPAARPTPVHSSSPEAKRLYLIARARLQARRAFGVDPSQGAEQLRQARRLLERATRLDPAFGAAWASLARAYLLVGVNLPDASGEALTHAEARRYASEALVRALELAPERAETHLARAEHAWQRYAAGDREGGGDPALRTVALQAFEEALAAAPEDIAVLGAYANAMAYLERFDHALALYDRALDLDPLSTLHLRRAETLARAGRLAAAREQFLQTGALFPESPWRAGMARIEFELQHLHHGVVWSQDNPGDSNLPFVLASLGDDQRLAAVARHFRSAGGQLGTFTRLVFPYLERDYRAVLDHARQLAERDRPPLSPFTLAMQRYIAALYLRRWQTAERHWRTLARAAPKFTENITGTEAGRERVLGHYRRRELNTSLFAAYRAYHLDRLARRDEAARLWAWSDELLDGIDPLTPLQRMAVLHIRALGEAGRDRRQAALDTFSELIARGWRHRMGMAAVGEHLLYRGDLLWFEDSPLLDSIRDHPRFRAVVEAVGAANAEMLAELNAGLSVETLPREDLSGLPECAEMPIQACVRH